MAGPCPTVFIIGMGPDQERPVYFKGQELGGPQTKSKLNPQVHPLKQNWMALGSVPGALDITQ